VVAVNNVSFSIEEGECVGIIGESGSGKTTLASLIAGFERPDSGKIIFQGKRLYCGQSRTARNQRRNMQVVFQHSASSFQPRSTVLDGVCDGIRYKESAGTAQMRDRAAKALYQVGIPESYFQKKCCELSGGECQRVAIARAISGGPQLILLDEVTSALDVSIQAQIMHLLHDLQHEMSMSYLFISHDIAVVAGLCDKILVLKNGCIIEAGTPRDILHNPKEEYTKQLMLSVLTL